MFLPIGDTPNPKGVPLVTWALIVANVAVFLLFNLPLGSERADRRDPAFREYVLVMSQELGDRVELPELVARTSAFDLFTFVHGYRPASPRLASLLTCMFLHGGFMHLFGNMLFLWIYGDNVERHLGAIPYLFAYLVTGILATLAHAVVFASSEMPLVGASGAISGILGFYFVLFPRNQIRMLAFLPPFLMQVFLLPARWVLGAFVVFDNLLPFLFAGEAGVAHGAHLGGFLAGAATAWFVERRTLVRPPETDAGRDAAARPEADELGAEAVRAALDAGRYEEAARGYFALPASSARGVVPPREAVALAGWLRESGRSDAALALLRRVVRDSHVGEGLAEAYALAGAILLQDMGEPTAAYQYLLSALELSPDAATRAEVRDRLREIEALQKRRVGRLHSPNDW
jgi:membrane associated rhomboid family serine protease